ncbi:MAG: glycoside hydrolase family protein [Bacteroidota bacterium]
MKRREFVKNSMLLGASTSLLSLPHDLSAYTADTGPLEESWFCKSLDKKGHRILHDQAGWNVWGCSPIYGEDGRVHVFFSRWPGDHGNWLSKSEIAHAVADKPEGPYKVLGTVLKGRGEGYWDADTIHNPTVHKVGDRYVMVYIGNSMAGGQMWRDRAQYANTQKIGIAVADSLDGPWTRVSDEPIINTSANPRNWDSYCVVNPSLLLHPNGQFWLYYRAWDRDNDDMRKTGLAISDKLEGPYIKYENNPIIDNQKYKKKAQCEDPYFFHYEGKFHCVIKDMGLRNYHSGLYFQSEDGMQWSKPTQAYHLSTHYFDEPEKQRFERPQILMKDGKPDYLFCALMGGPHNSSGACLKIHLSQE